MNTASQWRLSLARQLVPAYTEYPHVQAVILGGSAARGYADPYSDLELGVFWSQPPTNQDRERAFARACGARLTMDAYDPAYQWWIEDYYVQGVNIDVVHRTIPTTDQLIADVIERSDTSLYKQTLIAAIRDAVPFVGHSHILRWQSQTEQYPNALMYAVVQASMTLKPWWSVEVAAQRDSLILVHQALSVVSEKVLAALLAINRQYHPGIKWLPDVIAKLAIAPEAFHTRLRRCFEGPLDGRVLHMAALIEDVFTLAERHVPSLNIASVRTSFHQRRAPIEPPEEGSSS
jgi:hypothetical protein